MSVLVLGGEQRSALAVTRSLGRRGLPVHVGAKASRCLAGASRWASAVIELPDPVAAPRHYADQVIACWRRERYALVVPVTDDIVAALLSHPQCAELPWLAPPAGQYFRLVDKAQVLEQARAYGLPIPTSLHAGHADELEACAERVGFPCFVKPARSAAVTASSVQAGRVQRIDGPDELRRWREATAFPAQGVVVQQRVIGQGRGVFVLAQQGQVLAEFAHERIHERPPAGGCSVYSRSTALPQALAEPIRRLLADLRWDGVAMFEFKDDADGTPRLMEVNGRFWGSLQLAIDAGVDFPWLMYQLVTQGHVDGGQTYQPDVRLRWSLGCLDHLYLRLRGRVHSDVQLPSVWRMLAQCLLPDASRHDEIRRADDTAPFWFELRQYFRRPAGGKA